MVTKLKKDFLYEGVDLTHTALLYGGVDLGYYYVNIYIGTPPVR
jgi:hypothetical protein